VDDFFDPDTLAQFAADLPTATDPHIWQGELEHTTKAGKKLVVASCWTLTPQQSGEPQSF
jgi:hypothetical protein